MQILFILLIVGIAVYTDLKAHRIYNANSLAALLGGFILHLSSEPFSIAMTHAFYGALGAFLVFLPFYCLKGMAAGDVKLMTGCGAILGWPYALLGAGLSLVAGSILGIAYYLALDGRKGFVGQYWPTLSLYLKTTVLILPQADENSAAKSRFPYALAIACGSVLAMLVKHYN